MADTKKSIVEEALLDLKTITEALEANTKEILRSVAIGEINGVVKESINEDMYDETDVDDTEDELSVDGEVEGGEMDADAEMEPSVDSEVPAAPVAGADDELGGLDLGAESGEDQSALAGSEDYEFDLTGASDDDVISVYKKLAGDDEIEVVSPNEVIIKDPNGAEYNVKFGNEGAAPEAPMAGGLDLDLDGEDTLGIGAAPEVELEPSAPAEPAADAAPEGDMDAPTDDFPADDTATADDEEEDEDKIGESVVFEIALGDMGDDELAEDIIRGKGHDTHLQNGTMDSGDIEGTKADKDSDSGDNLTGGFDDDAVSHANAEGPMVMGENEEVEDIAEGEEETIEEAIPVGNAQARRVPGENTPIKGAGAKSLEEANTRYNALLAEARKLKAENEEFKSSLKKFRQMLGETVVFNQNLTYVTKLFLEHSTTSDEKQNILGRFDSQVTTIAESKRMYKTIAAELANKKPLAESAIETKIVKESAQSAVSGHLNESTAYIHPDQKRIQELMKRVENR